MKKLLFLLLLSIAGYSQGNIQQSVQKVDSLTNNFKETERLIDKYSGKIYDNFSVAMAKATPLMKAGFKMAVFYQIGKGVSELFPLFLFLIFLPLTYRENSRILNDPERTYGESSVFLIIFGAITFIAAIFALFNTMSGITRIIGPEWYALKDIINTIKN